MRIIPRLVAFFFVLASTPCFAALTGDYELVKGPETCPTGSIQSRGDTVVFGATHSWTLEAGDVNRAKAKGTTHEEVEGGCSYTLAYEKEDSFLKVVTKREKCPEKSENQTIEEKLELKGERLIYSFGRQKPADKRQSYQCEYKKKE